MTSSLRRSTKKNSSPSFLPRSFSAAANLSFLGHMPSEEKSESPNDQPHQLTWRYWGEEKVAGGIYSVYLKKVRYHSPAPTSSISKVSELSKKSELDDADADDDEISHLEWETVRVRFIKAGSLEKLVESLASELGEIESTYVNVFLATYRSFASAKQVLNLLLQRYDDLRDPNSPLSSETRDAHRRTLRQAMHLWLDQYVEDFDEPPNYPCLSQIQAFCQSVMPDSELDRKVRRKSRGIRGGRERRGANLHLEGVLDDADHDIDHDDDDDHHDDDVIDCSFVSGRRIHSSPLMHHLLSTSMASELATELNVKSPQTPSTTTTTTTTTSSATQHASSTSMLNSRHRYTNLLPRATAKRALINSEEGKKGKFEEILDIPDRLFAQQLTKMDYELFKRVIPHQCLGSVWSGRDKSRERDAASVLATVDQFNAVSYRVLSTILTLNETKSRARVIAKWVDVAQELRVLKNFSSLKAIVSGLQSNPIYRLSRSWSQLSREKSESFDELARIFSEENNAHTQRQLLVKEGTAKFAENVGSNDHHLQKVLQRHQSEHQNAVNYGTIPYLGTFLTDLTMVDAAMADRVTDDGLINFEKRRKEFEILAQIKLLQGAAKNYSIESDSRFVHWWHSLLVLDEREAFELSCSLESSATTDCESSKVNKASKKKSDAISETTTTTTTSTTSSGLPMGSVRSHNTTTSSRILSSAGSSHSSLPSLDNSLNLSTATEPPLGTSTPTRRSTSTTETSINKSKASVVSAPCASATYDPYKTPEFYIIRVSLASQVSDDTDGVILYKSIMVGNQERTNQVIANALLKHSLEDKEPSDFVLVQMLPDKELVIPDKANVYYAINTQHDLNFLLRPRSSLDETSTNVKEAKRIRDSSKSRKKLMALVL